LAEAGRSATDSSRPPDVFVSYAREDRDFVADQLGPALLSRGKEVWVDLDALPPASEWRDRTAAGIDAARALLFVLSVDAVASPECLRELARAVEVQKRLIPVLRRDVDVASVPAELEARNWIFMRHSDDFEHGLAQVVDSLETDLEWRDAHARLTVRSREWQRADRDSSYLLRGNDLAFAERWLNDQEHHAERATQQQTEYVLASRQAVGRRQRITLGAVALALAASVGLTIFALVQRSDAMRREQLSRSRQLAALSAANLSRRQDLAILLALEAYRARPTYEALTAMVQALEQSQHEVAVLRRPGFQALGVAVDPRGTRLAAGGVDGTVVMWDPRARRVIGKPFRPPSIAPTRGRLFGRPRSTPSFIGALAFTPDGHRLAVAANQTISLWDARTLRRIGGTFQFKDDVSSLQFLRDGTTLAVGGLNGTYRLWNTARGSPDGDYRPVPEGSAVLAFGAHGNVLALWQTDVSTEVIRLWDGVRRRYVGPEIPLGASIAVSPDGQIAAIGGDDGTIRVWDVPHHRPLGTSLRGHASAVSSLTFGADGRTLYSGGRDGTIRVWTLRQTPLARSFPTGRSFYRSLGFTSDGDSVALLGFDGRVGFVSVSNGALQRTIRVAGSQDLVDVAYSASGQVIAAAPSRGRARVWSLDRRPPTSPQLPGDPGNEAGVALSLDGTTVALVDTRNVVRFWDVERPRPHPISARHGGEAEVDVALSPDGTLAVTASLSALRLWDVGSGTEIALSPRGGGQSLVSFSPDGRTFATSRHVDNQVDEIAFWDVRRHQRIGEPARAEGSIWSLAWSPDGKVLVSAAENGEMTLWDVASRRPLGDPLFVGGTVEVNTTLPDVFFSPDGTRLMSLNRVANVWDRTLWSRNYTRWLTELCPRVGRNLTASEWADALPGRPYRRTCPVR
jgi:WD40 repeat protein